MFSATRHKAPRILSALLWVGFGQADFPGVAAAEPLRTSLWITNGAVGSIATVGDVLYVAGSFSKVGPACGGAVVLDGVTGTPTLPFPMVVGTVTASASDGVGGWYLGGDFTSVSGQPRSGLAHLDASGELTAWAPSVNGTVSSLVASAGVIYIGGGFSAVNGQSRSRLAAVDALGALQGWNPNPNGFVQVLAVRAGTIYAGGDFSSIGGQLRARLAAIDAATGVVTAWNPGADGRVNAFTLSGGTVYVGGEFLNVGSRSRFRVAALDAATGIATAWNPGVDGAVFALHTQSGVVYVGGAFGLIGGATRTGLAGVDSTSGLATSWGPGLDGYVGQIVATGTTMYIRGGFSTVGGQPRERSAAIDIVTGLVTGWSSAETPLTMAASGDSVVLVGGGFRTFGGVARSRIAAFDVVTGRVTDWHPTIGGVQGGQVYALAATDSCVYIGGEFTDAGGQPRSNVAALDLTTGAATAWNPATDGPVFSLAPSANSVFVGGLFTNVGGVSRNGLAEVSRLSGGVSGWNPSPNGTYIRDLALNSGVIYVSGQFSSIGGQLRQNLAAVDATTGVARPWITTADGLVTSFAFGAGGTVYIAGAFAVLGGQLRPGVGATDGESGNVLSWKPNIQFGGSSAISALEVRGSSVYLGGPFFAVDGQARVGLARVDAINGAVESWNPGLVGGTASVLLERAGTVYAGGDFTGVSRLPYSSLAGIFQGTVSVESPPVPRQRDGLHASPNPSSRPVTLRLSLTQPRSLEIAIYDLGGRVVRKLGSRDYAVGEHPLVWDGRDDAGHLVHAGLYFAAARGAGYKMIAKLLRSQ